MADETNSQKPSVPAPQPTPTSQPSSQTKSYGTQSIPLSEGGSSGIRLVEPKTGPFKK